MVSLLRLLRCCRAASSSSSLLRFRALSSYALAKASPLHVQRELEPKSNSSHHNAPGCVHKLIGASLNEESGQTDPKDIYRPEHRDESMSQDYELQAAG